MFGNVDAMAAILAVIGISLGALAIAVTIEVAKRSHHAMERFKQDMTLYVNQRLSQQDKDMRETLARFKHTMDDFESASEAQLNQMRTLAQELNHRFSHYDTKLDARLSSIRESIVLLEQSRNSQENQLSEVKSTMGHIARQTKKAKPVKPTATYDS